MSLGLENDDTRVCAVCKKRFDVLFPDQWRFKKMIGGRGWRYYCSWGHMRKDEREIQMEKYERQQAKKKATARPKKTVTEETFESKTGVLTVKKIQTEPESAAEEKQPETAEEQPKEAEQVGLVYDPSIREEYQREQAAKKAEKITEPVCFDGLVVRAVYCPGVGEFYFDQRTESIDWTTLAGDTVSLPPLFWKDALREIPRICRVLGIDLEAED